MSVFRHNFLRNTCVAFRDPEGLAQALGAQDQNGVSYAQRARRDFEWIVANLDTGASPAQLALAAEHSPETPPLPHLAALPEESARRAAAAVQALFEERFRPAERRAVMEPLGETLFGNINTFLEVPDEERMLTVQEAARALHAAMLTLPKGIWFWDDDTTFTT